MGQFCPLETISSIICRMHTHICLKLYLHTKIVHYYSIGQTDSGNSIVKLLELIYSTKESTNLNWIIQTTSFSGISICTLKTVSTQYDLNCNKACFKAEGIGTISIFLFSSL